MVLTEVSHKRVHNFHDCRKSIIGVWVNSCSDKIKVKRADKITGSISYKRVHKFMVLTKTSYKRVAKRLRL